MKSLILKDLYNIGHNAKSMLFILLVLAVTLVPTSGGVEGYMITCAIMCSMMIVTTFAFDDSSKWTRYALIMPVSKKELVAGKFAVLAIFCGVGSVFGLLVGLISRVAMDKAALVLTETGELMLLALVAWVIGFALGSMLIPLVLKFGAEKGRILLLVSVLVPTAILFGAYQLLAMLGVEFTDRLVLLLLCCSPVAALAWSYGMYQISCQIFKKQEL